MVKAKDEYCTRIDRLRDRLRAAVRHDLQRRRSHVQTQLARRGFGAFTARIAMRGRHAAELTHALRRNAGEQIGRRERQLTRLRLRLESLDLRRRLAAMRSRLIGAAGRMGAAEARRRQRLDGRLRTLAGRLESLSPLAVLGRGYAVAWNEDRTVILRRASSAAPGDRIHVTLHEGEIDCTVSNVRND
jgi:exodeoxyribonuclease VII large subunit